MTSKSAIAPGRCAVLFGALLLAGCSGYGASGPGTKAVLNAPKDSGQAISVVDVDDAVTARLLEARSGASFAEAFGEGQAVGTVIGKGDVLDITIWEAPPASLFGIASDARQSVSNAAARGTTMPDQMVDAEGRVSIPFVGNLTAAGRTPTQLAREITARLAGKAHDPQVVVRLSRNAAADVTVVGDVSSSTRVPLTPKGERLLDVIAAAGGVKQPIGKTTIQITRRARVVSLPLDLVIRDPAQNIRMQPDDVVTALFQPYSFTALGAVGANAEVPFEGNGITLAQALGRVGGLRDERANVRGVFIFRLENPGALDPALAQTARRTPDGRVPVIYRLDFAKPAAFFLAQSFPVQNRDVVYVSNAPIVEFQKFVNLVSSLAITGLSVTATVP